MNNSLKITKYIQEIISDNTTLATALTDSKNGLRVYPIDAKLGTEFPFVVVNRTNVMPVYCKDGNYKDTVYISILVASLKYEESIDVITMVRDTLECKRFKSDDIIIKDVRVTGVSETIIEDAFIQQIDFEIII